MEQCRKYHADEIMEKLSLKSQKQLDQLRNYLHDTKMANDKAKI
ncbi:hypothetical protein BMW23_0891 [Bodo saltans virus]|uniref:Uncharacterized protein n=1 Tax=Bodo saltans virus TaxID=2024608 RepID=A0A2H4UVP6_9VIRU|nr:hypothetical protein QJ851_gp0873 [Bodo saltans virus]ATZ80936.1 hypothetical protein BMW23_0891 [Bodo saltans virus]